MNSSSDIPKIGDTVFIESDRYIGEATVTYIDMSTLFAHHMLPIQVEISEGDLVKIDEFNHGQTMFRTNLKEIAGIQTSDKVIIEDEQESLFDDF